MTISTLWRRFPVVAIVASVLLQALPGNASADDEEPFPEEGTDIAVPGPEADQQLAELSDEVLQPQAAAEAAAPGQIDDFVRDKILTEGTAAEICHGGLRTGTASAFQTITGQFGGTAGTMYSCRERYATFERAECDGQVANPATNPNFFSDCWSNHAQGRAMDIMVGQVSGAWNQYRGNSIVNWLLATDSAGNVNANARRLGVQQILWNDKCWNSDGDRGIGSATAMRQCGYGHFDHVHIDLTLAGSEAATSYWGAAPLVTSKQRGLYFRDRQSGSWGMYAWNNLRLIAKTSGQWTPAWTHVSTGDWDADGIRDDLLTYNSANGAWSVRRWSGGIPAVSVSGTWSAGFDVITNGDFDDDGEFDDMILLDVQTGAYERWTWSASGAQRLGGGSWNSSRWDVMIPLDADSDGTVAETFLVDRDTGKWYVHRWNGATPVTLYVGFWGTNWDRFVSADLDAQGNQDDLFVRDDANGDWVTIGWVGEPEEDEEDPETPGPHLRAAGRVSTKWDHFTAGDYDTDGRVDDVFFFDERTGTWSMLSWHRYRATTVASSTWSTIWDQFAAGAFG